MKMTKANGTRKSKLTFVVGKGGVGKTTVSCAYALQLAARRPVSSVLLVSTDPAHSLADMLQVRLTSAPSRISGQGKLFAWQIDAGKEFQKFLLGNRDAILGIVESGTFFTREEIAPLLGTTLPGMAEVAGLLAIQELLEKGKYDHIVVDTAPFGHTLRLFELPAHFQRFLNFLNVASRRDAILAAHFGGRVDAPSHAFLERWKAMVGQVRKAFASENAGIFLVTSPETFSLKEAVRALRSLKEATSVPKMRLAAIVLNRVVKEAANCVRCRRRAQATRKAEQFLRKFSGIPIFLGPDPGNPILGVPLLQRFGAAVFQQRVVNLEMKPRSQAKSAIKFTKQAWPRSSVSLSFTVGKGGVGKTTTTAALAFHTRTTPPQTPVTVCSTDPAPSLDDIFEKAVGDQPTAVLGDSKFTAIEVDSVSEFRRWTSRVRQKLNSDLSVESGGVHVDLTLEKEILTAMMDVVPPGVDEVLAIFRILDLLESQDKIFIDMAPTGHALELLQMPERIQTWSRLLLKSLASHRTLAFAQDVAVELASLGQRVRKLIGIMKDPRQSRIWVVMLAEPVPDHQTLRLLQALEKIGITVDSLFVNRVLMPEKQDARCKRCRRIQTWQQAMLQAIKKKYRRYRIFVTPELSTEIAGEAALKKFTGKLWQIAD